MEWLHFSDFHVGGPKGPQDEALGCLVDFINTCLGHKSGTIDAVFLAGDISYSGKPDEYTRFEDQFLRPLLALDPVRNAKVFAVPGNHDVDCDASTPITWGGIRERNQQIYFCENEEGRNVRKPRAEVFRHYWEFVQRNGIISPNPFEAVSMQFEEPTFPFDILTLNTSFFCDKDDRSDEAIIPCPLSTLRDRLNGLERKRPLIILGHHPQRCFLVDQQTHFETLLIDKKATYLHGHEHKATVAANVDGTVRALGFGAGYVAALGARARAPYRNSFTRCVIGDHLHLNGYSWDSEVGRWDDTTRSQFSSCITDATYDGTSVILNLPLLSKAGKPSPHVRVLQSIPRKTPQPQAVAPISPPTTRIWLRLVSLSENMGTYYKHTPTPSVHSTIELDGKTEFVIEDGDRRDLLICIPGVSHILSAKEVESYNTRLDTEDLRSVTVVSFGKVSTDANSMCLRLRTRKAIEVLANRDLAAKWEELLSTRQVEALAQCDAGRDSVDILIDNDELHLLVVRAHETTAFWIVDAAGGVLPAAHQVVTRLREANTRFARMRYDGEPFRPEEPRGMETFDEAGYLKKCYTENNVMKYAALANVGIRFSDFALDKVYMDASACEVDADSSSRLDALLDDHLAVYPASEKLKAQIKEQFLSHARGETRHETSQAREFCQKFGAVLLTGDPGSGKTCFIKSEILAYARRATRAESESAADEWHSVHIPLMVPLSQAAAEDDLQTAGLLQVASRLLSRRGLYFPFDTMEEILRQGRLALFFDGLDEVVSVEKRALVVQHINDLVTRCLPLGNRVVVTSRPAAMNVVNLLPSLRKLELQGLTETEIRKLASRILTLKLSETTEGVIIDEKQSGTPDSAVVRQLLRDCAEKPGVARLAKNPLLLTLLVMIYANSGAPSAKRHRIYEEAIKTLASVRGRQTGHDPVSVQDLRERLGAVALSVYRKESGFLPTRGEVTEIVRGVMSRQRGETVAKVEADRFIQKVAESTGLIALGGDDRKGDDAAILTFMHHSFMEYFAAVALSRDLGQLDVASLVTQPRWVEILTLLAGIIGESADIAPVLAMFIGDGESFGEVDAKFLTFALDCALECEVPSEAAVRLLSSSISKCILKGPARCDPWVRSEIGHRLSQLISACGLGVFESSIAELMRTNNGDICAAAISLAGYAFDGDSESPEIIRALESCCSRVEENTQCAICEAAANVKWFRTQAVLHVIARCLKKTDRCKRAAFEAILVIPGLAAEHWPEIINGLGETEPSLRRAASMAAVHAGLDGDVATLNDAKKDVVANALQVIYESAGEQDYPAYRIRKETVERLLNSGFLRDRLIGIQMIPAVEGGDYAYRKLMAVLDPAGDHQEITAALRAIRSSRDARVLFTVADLKRVAGLCETGTSDVRKASIQLLGHFAADADAIKALLERDLSSVASSEYQAIFSSLSRAQVLQDEVVTLIEKEIMLRVGGQAKRNRSYAEEMYSLLNAACDLGRNLRADTTNAIRQLIRDYKDDYDVRRAALRAYPATAMPTRQVVEFLTELFHSPPVAKAPGNRKPSPPATMTLELVQTLGIFAKNCRQSVEYVIACVDAMSGLKDSAVSLHQKLMKKTVTEDMEFMVSELRDGIHEVDQIIVTFNEFISPVREDRVKA
jgi:hypothetical protein